MQVFGTLDIQTINTPDGGEDRWTCEISTPKTVISLDELRDLGKILRALADDPGAMHRAPKPDPTFCEEKL